MQKSKLVLFDIDGTLTEPRQCISKEMTEFLMKLNNFVDIGFVGGAAYDKHKDQVGLELIKTARYLFSQNGSCAFEHGVLFHQYNILDHFSNKDLNAFISYCLYYLSCLDLPVKRGTFIEFRSGMINICPLGRNASIEERKEFENYDKNHHIRETMIEALKCRFPDAGFHYLIGGQTSFDVVPCGLDKTYCLQFVSNYKEIHFFGDKILPGGNDHEIYEDRRTIGHHVRGPEDTKQTCTKLFML